MAWFKVDDKLHAHPKWLALKPSARALWVTAGSWCAANLTDGIVPPHVLRTLNATKRDAAELVAAGLWWQLDDDRGWLFNDWLDYQPSREQVEARRAEDARRKAEAREAARIRRLKEVS